MFGSRERRSQQSDAENHSLRKHRHTCEGYAFRGFYYVTTMVQLFFLGPLFDLCFDTGCIMSLIDRKFLRENRAEAEIKKMPTATTVKGIGRGHNASEYIKIKMYLPSKNGAVALIEREFYVVDDLTAIVLS